MKPIGFVAKSSNFCRTHEGKIQRIEEKHRIFPPKVTEAWLFEFSIDNSCQ
jgi:hypothetical protein